MKKGGTFVPSNDSVFKTGPGQPEAESAFDKARRALEILTPKLMEVFGENYRADPRFDEAVRAVMNGRAPWQVLADYTDKTPSTSTRLSREVGDGTGWAG